MTTIEITSMTTSELIKEYENSMTMQLNSMNNNMVEMASLYMKQNLQLQRELLKRNVEFELDFSNEKVSVVIL